MRLTITELPDQPTDLDVAWTALLAHVYKARSECVLLPEMPFAPWFARTRPFDATLWEAAVTMHKKWWPRLAELAPAIVLGSQPTNRAGQRVNEAFVHGGQYAAPHAKRYLPDDEGFWEASWYARGPAEFTLAQCGPMRVGFLICTELWFNAHARAYGKQGAHLIAVPRCTEQRSLDKWLVGGRAAAVVSGAYTASANRTGANLPDAPFGGQGWLISPDGEVLATTSEFEPFVTVDIDLALAEQAKSTYPRYVEE